MTEPPRTNQKPLEKNPVWQQENAAHMVNVLNRIILIISILAGFGLIAIPFLYERKLGSSLVIAALIMTIIVSKLLTRSGRVRLSAIFTVSGIWLIFAVVILLGDGLENINVVFFISMTVIAGLLFGQRAILLVTAAGIFMALILLLISHFGYLPRQFFQHEPLGNFAQLVFALILTANALNIALRDRDHALNVADKQLTDRLQAEDALRNDIGETGNRSGR